jgi:F-type H+-transporting ATPase subunit b
MPQTRSIHRVFLVLFLTAIVAGGAIAPCRLAAQESAPAAQPQPAAQAPASQSASKPEAPPSQEEKNQAFLLEGPIVKWTARTFNLSAATAAGIFEFINFAIIVLCIGVPLFRWLPRFLRQRGQTVRANIEAARKATEDANARLSTIEAKLSGLDGEIAQIRSQVEQESLQDEARIKAAIVEESARIVTSAGQEINVAAAQAQRELRHFAANLAIEQASRQLDLTPETDRALIAEFVGDVGKGGKN